MISIKKQIEQPLDRAFAKVMVQIPDILIYRLWGEFRNNSYRQIENQVKSNLHELS